MLTPLGVWLFTSATRIAGSVCRIASPRVAEATLVILSTLVSIIASSVQARLPAQIKYLKANARESINNNQQ